MKKRDVEKEVIREILKSCSLNLVEKIVVRIFYKTFLEFYHATRIKTINNLRLN